MPPRPIDTRHAGLAASSKRLLKTTPLVSHDAATGTFTIAAGSFMNDLAPGDAIRLSGLTGGSGLTGDGVTTYFLCAPRWNAGQTTFKLSASPNGPVVTGGTNATAGTVITGDLTAAESGLLSGNYVSQDSPAGR